VGGKAGTGGKSGTGGVSAGGASTGGTSTAGNGSSTGGSKATGGISIGGNATAGGASTTGGGRSAGGTATTGGTSPTGGTRATGGTSTVLCPSGSLCIDFTATQQEIDGLDACSAGHGVLNTAVLDASFKNDTLKQMGLSIIRVEIDAAGQSAWEQQKTNATAAKSRGAQYVMATPWSPPASMKTNGNVVGGELSTSSYADYAAYLKSFYTYMGGAGVVDVISVQNEPNITVTYTSCHWSTTQLYNFAKNNAGAIGVPVMIGEVSYFDTAYADPILNDATAAANVSYVGMHLYGGQLKPYTLAVQKLKKVWMTEHLFNPEDIGTMMTMAKEIMDCFENQFNAYVWWYLALPDCNLVSSSGALTNKGYVMGQFSKYIRPGSHRVTATYQPQTNVNVQAFAGTNNVIVALNRGTSAVSLNITVTKGSFANAHKYTTSNTKKLSDDGAVTVSNGSFTASLDAQSVTTFVGAP
jgi:glucuronoarabinoxylan endo-1,4-beta-xylanase